MLLHTIYQTLWHYATEESVLVISFKSEVNNQLLVLWRGVCLPFYGSTLYAFIGEQANHFNLFRISQSIDPLHTSIC